ncbi:hypothetical protein LINPERHAP1_LOCUS18658, partial [Linum perenne]
MLLQTYREQDDEWRSGFLFVSVLLMSNWSGLDAAFARLQDIWFVFFNDLW